MKKLLLYARKDENGQRLGDSIQKLMSNNGIESFGTVDTLIKRHREPVNAFVLTVFIAGTRNEFSEIISRSDLIF